MLWLKKNNKVWLKWEGSKSGPCLLPLGTVANLDHEVRVKGFKIGRFQSF